MSRINLEASIRIPLFLSSPVSASIFSVPTLREIAKTPYVQSSRASRPYHCRQGVNERWRDMPPKSYHDGLHATNPTRWDFQKRNILREDWYIIFLTATVRIIFGILARLRREIQLSSRHNMCKCRRGYIYMMTLRQRRLRSLMPAPSVILYGYALLSIVKIAFSVDKL